MTSRLFVRLTLVLLLLPLGGAGCSMMGRTIASRPSPPPLAPLTHAHGSLIPRSQRYRLAVREVVDQTGKADVPARGAGQVLVTELYAKGRFDLYDVRDPEKKPSKHAHPEEPPAKQANPEDHPVPVAGDDYQNLRGVVDGVLESHATAINARRSWMDVDYRVVDPYTGMVVTSGQQRLYLEHGGVLRSRVKKLVDGLARGFARPKERKIRAIEFDESSVKITLDGGDKHGIRRGFVGFVYEEDPLESIDRYLAKFVIVNVFDGAAVGVVVDHCNGFEPCSGANRIPALEQAKSIDVGSRVRFK